MTYLCIAYLIVIFLIYSYILYDIAYSAGLDDATYDYEDFTKEEYADALRKLKND